MEAVRIRVNRMLDFGTLVSVIGTELETTMPIAVHVDLCPCAETRRFCHGPGLPQPIVYDAAGCTLTLDLAPPTAGEATHG
jgi:hypothetical protein